mmetsp:Transcript_2085/g.4220  ORF Transcript_2085/g.4220 Transcript_2085/m.4220 type:complete len:106 (-) Transcript_2085:1485-1802(-)
MTVLPSMTLSMAPCTSSSLWASRALVASSKSNMLGSTSKALAIAILCFCPPLSLTPLSPTRVSYPSVKVEIKSWQFAILLTSSILSLLGREGYLSGSDACFAAQP